ncbi:MAG: hypothetical protein ACLVEU_08600 [Bacteroides cellulosilyticus]
MSSYDAEKFTDDNTTSLVVANNVQRLISVRGVENLRISRPLAVNHRKAFILLRINGETVGQRTSMH